MTPLRIGLVTRQYPPDSIGGIGSYVREVAHLLAAAGHRPVVIHTAPGQRRETTWDDGVQVERFPPVGPDRLWNRTTPRTFHLAERTRAALSALRAVRSLPPFDVIEAPEWKAEGLLLRWARRGPVTVHLHLLDRQVMAATGITPGLGRRLAGAMEVQTARWAHSVTASSTISFSAPEVGTFLDPADVRLVAAPLRPGCWAEVPPASSTAPVVLCMGRLEARKAPETVINALARLRIADARAVFVGRAHKTLQGEPYDAYLQHLADEAGIECELVDATTDTDQLCALLARARVVAVPSRFETLSMVALEAMAAARPVVLSTRVGLAEWLTDHAATPVVPLEDHEGWADALGRFLMDPAVAADAGLRNRARALELTDPGRVVESRVAGYDTVIARSRDRRWPSRAVPAVGGGLPR